MDLGQMFGTGNPFRTEMGMQAFQADQAKAQQALQAAQGQEQRAQAMQPLEEAHKQALTRQGNANAATVEDSLAAQVPAAERLKQKMLELHSKGTELERSQREADMYERGQNAAIIKANGGQIPVWLLSKIPQNEIQMYQGKGLDTTMNILKAYHETHPKTMETRARQEAELEKARIAAGPGYARAEATKAAASARTGSASKMSDAQLSNYYEMKAADTDDPDLKAEYQALADRAELKALRKIREGVEVRKEGEFDLSAKGVPTVPRTGPTATPRDGTPATPKPKEVDVETFSPEQKKAAAAIREQFYNKKITQEQAIQQIEALAK